MPGKSALGSLTIVSSLVVLLAQLVQLAFGYTISPADQAKLVEVVNQSVTVATTIATMIGAVGAILGRVRASRPVTSVLPKGAGPVIALLFASGLSLSACQVADVDRGKIAEIERACSLAMALAPAAPEIAPWIVGGCGTAQSIAKLAEDPGSLAWVMDLIAKARALR